MTVVFDLLYAQPLGGAKFHGGGEYIKSVFSQLCVEISQEHDVNLIVCLDKNLYIDDWILEEIESRKIHVEYVSSALDICNFLWQLEGNTKCTFFTGMIYQYEGCNLPEHIRKIGVCHGLRALEKPFDVYGWLYAHNKSSYREAIASTFLPKLKKKKAINRLVHNLSQFDIVITVSYHSAYSIKVNLGRYLPDLDLRVYYTPQKCANLIECKTANNEEYILMVSANRWLKNAYRGVTAIDELYEMGLLKGIKTRVYGSYPQRLRKRVKNKKFFEFYDYVETEELERAYQGCKVFFYPTLNEGFGLPPMEAMKYGKTCVISGVASLPEVYGDSVYYCNPYDKMEMANRILLAVERPIAENIINERMMQIANIQESDLQQLCEIIIK